MIWIAPLERNTITDALEKRIWDAAGQFRASPGLKSREYSGPILQLIFLRFAEVSALATGIQDLRRTGDLLLPRLLSGHVNLGESDG